MHQALLNAADGAARHGGRVAVHASDGQPISRREKARRNVACATQAGAREVRMRGEDNDSVGVGRSRWEGKRETLGAEASPREVGHVHRVTSPGEPRPRAERVGRLVERNDGRRACQSIAERGTAVGCTPHFDAR